MDTLHSASFDLFHLDEDVSAQLHGSGDCVKLPFNIIEKHDQEYAERVLNNPVYEVNYLSQMASGFVDRKTEVHLIGIPNEVPIHRVRSKDLYKLVQITGTVIQRGEKNSRPRVLVYHCPKCSDNIRVEQTEQWRIAPEKCQCDNRKGFTKVYDKTEFHDYQWIEIQELVENTPNGKTPEKIKCLLKNALVDSCVPGEVITIAGVPKVAEKSPNTLKLEMQVYVEAVGLENDTEDLTVEFSEADIAEIRGYMESPDHLDNIRKSYAPTVYGLDHIKEALAYQQCEGVTRIIDGDRQRGQIHILLAGSPGVAKSVLGKYSARYHPKGREAAARSTSAAGLTAAVVKDGDEFVLKAGAMVLADRGFLFVDEAEKMHRDDSGAMHPGMEAQEIEVNKGGISAKLKCRCSVLMACNPITGLWNDDELLIPNLNKGNQGMALPLLDRCALIYVVRMEVDAEKERRVIRHISDVQETGELDVPYGFATLVKMFSYARTLSPTVPQDILRHLEDFYITLFKAGTVEGTTYITRRDYKDMIRITEASAKLHGREVAIYEDAENAKRVKAESIKEYGIDPVTGTIDQSSLFMNKPASRINRMKQIQSYIKNHLNDEGYLEYDDYIDGLSNNKFKELELNKLLEDMENIIPPMVYRNGDKIKPC